MQAGAPADGIPSARLGARRIYILPTRHGLLYAAVLVLMLIGSINYGNALGFVLTFLLAGLYLVCTLHTQRNLLALVVRAGKTRPVHAGEAAEFEIVLDNTDGPDRPAIEIAVPAPRWRPALWRRKLKATQPSAWTDVAAGAVTNLALRVPAPRRGWLALQRVVVSSRFPLGLFRAWAVIEVDMRTLVYPAPRGLSALPAHVPDDRSTGASQARGADDFAGFQTYRPGDSPRYIAWKAVARGAPLLVKRFSGSGAALWLDYESLARLPDTEQRLAQLCRWVLAAEEAGVHYGLRLPRFELPSGSGQAHRDAALKALALHGLPQ